MFQALYRLARLFLSKALEEGIILLRFTDLSGLDKFWLGAIWLHFFLLDYAPPFKQEWFFCDSHCSSLWEGEIDKYVNSFVTQ